MRFKLGDLVKVNLDAIKESREDKWLYKAIKRLLVCNKFRVLDIFERTGNLRLEEANPIVGTPSTWFVNEKYLDFTTEDSEFYQVPSDCSDRVRGVIEKLNNSNLVMRDASAIVLRAVRDLSEELDLDSEDAITAFNSISEKLKYDDAIC